MKSLLLIAAALGSQLVSTSASACSCIPFDFQVAYAEGQAVMLAVPRSAVTEDDPSPFAQTRYEFEVGKIYQGPVAAGTETVSLTTPSQGSMCGASFELNQPTLVWFYERDDGSLGTSLCQGSGPLEAMLEPYRWLEAQ